MLRTFADQGFVCFLIASCSDDEGLGKAPVARLLAVTVWPFAVGDSSLVYSYKQLQNQ